MKNIFLVVAVLIAVPAFGQVAHDRVNTPTLEDCREDAALLQAKVNKAATSFSVLGDFRNEMHNCREVDPAYVAKYVLVCLTIENELRWRLERYLQRHSDTKQFLEEDEAGTR